MKLSLIAWTFITFFLLLFMFSLIDYALAGERSIAVHSVDETKQGFDGQFIYYMDMEGNDRRCLSGPDDGWLCQIRERAWQVCHLYPKPPQIACVVEEEGVNVFEFTKEQYMDSLDYLHDFIGNHHGVAI
jgi:hypothetical protein